MPIKTINNSGNKINKKSNKMMHLKSCVQTKLNLRSTTGTAQVSSSIKTRLRTNVKLENRT